jgi:hypothetical protein
MSKQLHERQYAQRQSSAHAVEHTDAQASIPESIASTEQQTVGANPQVLLARIQHTHGNQAVQRLIQRDGASTPLPAVPNYQLRPPSFGRSTPRPSLLDEGQQLHLDPAIEAEIWAIQARQALSPALLLPGLMNLSPGPLQLPGAQTAGTGTPLGGPPTPAAAPAVPRGEGPAEPRAASASDLLRAMMSLPAVDQALRRLQEQAGEQVRRDWSRLRLGEQIGLVSVLTLIAGGTVAGVVSDPEARRFVFGQLNGRVIPVPGLPWLRTEFNTSGDGVMFGLHLDVGQFFPSIAGFGPGSSPAIGGPPQPERSPWSP